MRKIGLIPIILLFAAPALARVDIICTKAAEPNTFLVSYNVVGEPNKVRAFALDITVDEGARITDVNDQVNPYYNIYPGSGHCPPGWNCLAVVIYTPVADPWYPGTLPGLDTNGVTIEMGALWSPPYDNSPNAPPLQGDLLKFTVGGIIGCNFKVTIAENEARGGVVLTDPTLTPVVNSPGYVPILPCDCFPYNYTTYKDWVLLGKPDCWCAPPKGSGYQCDGDTDNATETLMKYRIYMNDLNILVVNWKKKITDPTLNPCADIDHKSETFSKYRVYMNDLNKLVANWKKKDAQLLDSCPRPE